MTIRLYFGGGLNEQKGANIHEAAAGSYNFELSKDTYQLRPRKPFDLADTAPNGKPITGIMQLIKKDNTETTLVQAGETVYQWAGSNSFTAVGTVDTDSNLRDCHWPLDDYLVITDLQKQTVVKRWNGTGFTSLSTGLGSDLYAKYAITHRGRVWLFNVKTSSDTPHLMVASQFENPISYDTTKRAGDASLTAGTEAFYMLTPDLKPINGVALFHGDLVISTLGGRTYKLTGTNSTNYAWVDFYAKSNAIGYESMVNIGNDVAYMREGGNIEALTGIQQYGDVSADDLSRWIPDTVRNLTGAIAVYDQTNQKVYFFVSGKILVFYKDIFYGGAMVTPEGERMKLSPWSVYRSQLGGGSLSVSAAKYMRYPSTTTYTVIFGDDSGRLLDINGSGSSGDGGSDDVTLVRKTRYIDERYGQKFNRVTKGTVEYRRTTECDITLTHEWGDEYNTSDCTLTLKGPPTTSSSGYWGGSSYWAGSFYWSEAFSFSDNVSHQNYSPVGRGSGMTLTISSENSVQYIVDSVILN
jgi:hypothetical protein